MPRTVVNSMFNVGLNDSNVSIDKKLPNKMKKMTRHNKIVS